MDVFLLCALLIACISSLLTSAQEYECPASMCPDAWVTFRGSCYYVSDNVSVDWIEATHHCKAHHAELITIQTADEDKFIRSQLERFYRTASQHPGQEFWLGANDQMIEGVWEWYTDNSSLNYAGWYPGQPGSEGDEDCAVIASRSDVFNGWHDAPCAALHHPICEISPKQIQEIIGK